MNLIHTYGLAEKWLQLTGFSLRAVVDFIPYKSHVEVIGNPEKLERIIQPSTDQSIKEKLIETYGNSAAEIFLQLLK